MQLGEEMRIRVTEAFAPCEVEIIDESEQHRGHAGYREGGQSHFRMRIRSASFASMSRIQRHRAVHDVLGPQIMTRLHALSLDLTS